MLTAAFKSKVLDVVVPKWCGKLRVCESDDECIGWKTGFRGALADILVHGKGLPQEDGAGFCYTVIKRVSDIWR